VPEDWNSASNYVEVYGAGGSSGAIAQGSGQGGGGAGAYSKQINISLTPGGTATYQIGKGGSTAYSTATVPYAGVTGTDTFFNRTAGSAGTCADTTSACAKGGAGPASGTTGGAGGVAASGTGGTKFAGGAGGAGNSTGDTGGGGGGAGGLVENGKVGGAGFATNSGSGGGGGGGGAGDNSGANSSVGSAGVGANGGNGGAGPLGTGAGTGGSSTFGADSTAGTGGGGGGGDAVANSGGGGEGGSGDLSVSYGGGGGGGVGESDLPVSQNLMAGDGGFPGGGGGGALSNGFGGNGAIVISYDPYCMAKTTGNWSTGSNWSNCTGAGGKPGAGDTVIIKTGVTMTMDEASAALGSLTINGAINTSNGTSWALSATTITISTAGVLTANASAISLTGTTGTLFTITGSGAFNANTSTVTMSGNGSATINAGTALTFNNLASTGTGTKTLSALNATVVGGTLVVSAGTILTVAADFTVTGTTTINGGTLTLDNNTGTKKLTGAVAISSGTLSGASTAIQVENGISRGIAGTVSITGTATFQTNAQSLSGTLSITTVVNNVTTGSGLTITDSGVTITTLTQGTNDVLTFSGTMPTITTLDANTNVNTVQYTGSSQAIRAGTYSSLTVNGSGTATIGGTTVVNSTMTATSPVTNNSTLTVTTALSGASTLTQGASSTLNIGGTSGITTLDAGTNANTVAYNGGTQTIKSSNYSALTINSVGTKTLGGTVGASGVVTVSTGDLDTGNYDLTGSSFVISDTSAVTLGSSTITATGTGTVWNYTSSGAATAGTSTIKFTDTSASGKTFAGNGKTYNNFWYAPGAGTGTLTVTGANTFADFRDNSGLSAHTIIFPASTTTTLTSWSVSGASGNVVTINSSSAGTPATLSDTTGTNTCDYCSIQDSTATGGATWTTTNSTEGTGNSGWVFPQTRYWVGGTASWDGTAGTKWATASGGAGGASIPTSATTVYFDASSGAGTVTIASGNTGVKDLIFTGFTGTLAGSTDLAISGSLTMGAGMTNSYTGSITFNATSGTKTVTSNGKSFSSYTYFDGVGGTWQIADAFSTTGPIFLENGILNTNNQTITTSSLQLSNSNVRTLSLGSSSVNITSGASGIQALTTTNMTFNAGTSTITISGTGAIINSGGLTFYNVVLGGGGTVSIDGINSYNNLTITGTAVQSDQVQIFANQTITGTLTINGNSSTNRLLVNSQTLGTARTLTAAAVSLTNVDFMDITGAGAASPFTGTSLGNALGNSGITFTQNSGTSNGAGGVYRYWVASAGTSTGSWSTTTRWSTSSNGSGGATVPLPQDTVVFDANSIDAGSRTITMDMPRIGLDINMGAATNSPTFSFSQAATLYGSLVFPSGSTTSGTVSRGFTFATRSTANLTSNTGIIKQTVNINALNGTVTLLDSFSNGSANLSNFIVTRGTLNLNNYDLTTGCFYTVSSDIRSINLGSGTLTNSSNANCGLTGLTNLTFNAGTSTIKFTGTLNTDIIWYGGNQTFYNLWFSRGASTGKNSISGSNTFNDIKDTGTAAHTLEFTAGTTQTMNSFNVSGTAGNLITINSTTTGTHALTLTGGGFVESDYLNIQHSVASPANTWYAGANSTNNQGVATAGSGWIFTVAPDCTLGTTGNWNTGSNWTYCSGAGGIPSTADDVTVTADRTVTLDVATPVVNSLLISGTLNTSNGTSWGLNTKTLNIDATGTLTANASTVTLSGTTGTLFTKHASGTFNNGTSTVVLSGNGSATVNSGTVAFTNLTSSGTGTKTLAGTVTVSGNLVVSAGTVDLSTSTPTITGTSSVTGTLTDSSVTGTNTFTGGVTVNSGGTWNNTNDPAYSFAGGLTVNTGATFTSGAGAYTFATGEAQTIGGTLAAWSITNLTNNDATSTGLTFSGAQPTITTLTQGTNAILTFSGTVPTITTLTATASPNTVQYTSTSAQTVKGTTYHHLTKTGVGGTATLGGNAILNGNLTISSGTLELSTLDFTTTGTSSITGTLSDTSATGTNLFTGAVTINSGGIWSTTNNPAFTFRGGLTNNSSSGFTSGTGIYTFNTNVQTISGSQSFTITNITNDITSSTGLTFSGAQPTITTLTQGTNGVLTFSGTVPTIITLTATASPNTVQYTGSTQTMKGTTYDNLTINSSGTATLGGAVDANNNFAISGGTLNTGNHDIIIGGNYSNSGTLTAGTGTVTFDSNAIGKTLTGNLTGTSKFNNLTFNNATGAWTLAAIATEVGGNLIINSGALTAPSTTLTIGGNFSNTPETTSSFVHNSGTVVFNTAATSSVVGDTTFNNLTVATDNKTVLLGAGDTFRTNGLLTLTGSAYNSKVNVDSTTGNSKWFLNHQGTESIAFVQLDNSGCDAASTDITMDSGSNDGSNNSFACWKFIARNRGGGGGNAGGETSNGSGAGDCADGIQNGNETGIDQGGRCLGGGGSGGGGGGAGGEGGGEGSGTCADGIQNGNETGVDTGGRCAGGGGSGGGGGDSGFLFYLRPFAFVLKNILANAFSSIF